MNNHSYLGYLIAAHPSNPRDELYKSVMLIVRYTNEVTVAVKLNTPHPELTLDRVFESIKLDNYSDCPIFFGGVHQTNKIHVIHSLDWQGITTMPLTSDIGITHDISVIAALSKNQGPEYFRACAGYGSWDTEHFNTQLDPTSLRNKTSFHNWEVCPATIENTFLIDPQDQWKEVLEQSARYAVNSWLGA